MSEEKELSLKGKYVWFLLLSLFLLFFDRTIGLGSFKDQTARFLFPLQEIAAEGGRRMQGLVNYFISLPRVYRENLRLEEELVEYQGLRAENALLREENQDLRNQLNAPISEERQLIPARVLGYAGSEGERRLVIEGNFAPGGTVILKGMLVGLITDSGSGRSQVKTIYSSRSRVAAQVIKGNQKVEGLVEGRFASEVYLTKVLASAEIGEGDTVISSGQAGRYPRGLVIGEIKQLFGEESEVYQSARLWVPWNPKEVGTVFVMK